MDGNLVCLVRFEFWRPLNGCCLGLPNTLLKNYNQKNQFSKPKDFSQPLLKINRQTNSCELVKIQLFCL